MAQSNRAAVEANKIDPDERLDLVVPRNGSLTIQITLSQIDDNGVVTPIDLSGETITAGVKISYDATHAAFVPVIGNRDDINGKFSVTYPASKAKGLGIDVLDCVQDCMRAPSGGGEPKRIFAGLLEFSKGVS